MRQQLWKFVSALALFAMVDFQPAAAAPVNTAFTYQGQLTSGGVPANGFFDFTFSLFGANNLSSEQIGLTQTNLDVGVTNGLFCVTLSFGPVFDGNNDWLSIQVQTNGGAGFTLLSPLQEITPAPYALYSPSAGTAATAVSVPLSALPSIVVTNGESTVNIAGNFTGNGGGLTNLPESALIPPSTLIPVQTNTYYPHLTASFTVPPLVTTMVVKLWGAGGGTSLVPPPQIAYAGGGGAFSTVTLNVTAGQTYTVVVGQAGTGNPGQNGGGFSTTDTAGGTALGGFDGGAGGGQATSLFLFTGSSYIAEAIAGGGGGGGTNSVGGGGGNPGQDPSGGGGGGENGVGGAPSAGASPGMPYFPSAISTGLPSLNSALGDGGAASPGGGGGGGGYGGGAGGSSGFGGSGGGSYGQVTGAPGSLAANQSDPNYIAPWGSGGSDGLAVVIFYSEQVTPFFGVQADWFLGNGSLLTNLSATGISGVIPSANLPTSLSGSFSGSFSGDGSKLTNVALTSTVNTFNGNQFITNGTPGSGPSTVATLNVVGAIRARGGPINGYDTTDNGYTFGPPGDNDSGMSSSADGQLEFYSNGGEAMRLAAGGYFGIGITNPTNPLAVNGTIRMGPSASNYAVSSGESLRILRGYVSAAGAIQSGSGYTVSHPSTGVYVLSFTTAFNDIPAVTGTTAGGYSIGLTGSVGSSQITFNVVQTTDAVLSNQAFAFIAIGAQ